MHEGRVVAFISIEDDPDRLLPDRIADSVEPGDQDEARNPLSLCRRYPALRLAQHEPG